MDRNGLESRQGEVRRGMKPDCEICGLKPAVCRGVCKGCYQIWSYHNDPKHREAVRRRSKRHALTSPVRYAQIEAYRKTVGDRRKAYDRKYAQKKHKYTGKVVTWLTLGLEGTVVRVHGRHYADIECTHGLKLDRVPLKELVTL